MALQKRVPFLLPRISLPHHSHQAVHTIRVRVTCTSSTLALAFSLIVVVRSIAGYANSSIKRCICYSNSKFQGSSPTHKENAICEATPTSHNLSIMPLPEAATLTPDEVLRWPPPLSGLDQQARAPENS